MLSLFARSISRNADRQINTYNSITHKHITQKNGNSRLIFFTVLDVLYVICEYSVVKQTQCWKIENGLNLKIICNNNVMSAVAGLWLTISRGWFMVLC